MYANFINITANVRSIYFCLKVLTEMSEIHMCVCVGGCVSLRVTEPSINKALSWSSQPPANHLTSLSLSFFYIQLYFNPDFFSTDTCHLFLCACVTRVQTSVPPCFH
ncbi:hypothetical protein ILYODFUR_037086 [Ilyodon furcidens]|uniref:Uncharacterized protein n=1 Tax=Ilyodon furcidens TaxID=33524 RepID=A0ABV0V977_9TELE